MIRTTYLKAALAGGMSTLALVAHAHAANYNIPSGDLKSALDSYAQQTAVALLYPEDAIRGVRTRGAQGDLSASDALSRILAGTGFVMRLHSDGAITIVHETHDAAQTAPVVRLAQAEPRAAAAASSVETVVVTSSKIKGDIQTVPIAITALSQEQLTSRQIAGGPDLVKEVPNLTFSKTNFSGYTITIRGIGTQAISVTTDPAVAVALNDTPFIRNHFFEQEFFDVNQVEVLRGPQGTLYGRNATAGVVNVVTAKPTDQFEAMLSADWGNYTNRRYEGMVNIPIVDDRLDLRIAGEWTKRSGYSVNENTGDPIDGRDLWSTRVTLGIKPMQNLQATLVWEHFGENDDRMRTAKQLCKTDPGPSNILGQHVQTPAEAAGAFSRSSATAVNMVFQITESYLSQGCLPASLYSPDSFEVPNGYALPYVVAAWVSGAMAISDPYEGATNSRNLRDIETQINPRYVAKNDTLEFNADYNVTPALTFTSQTGYNQDFLYSTEDYNRFNTAPGIFIDASKLTPIPRNDTLTVLATDCGVGPGPHVSDGTYYFDDPQLGCGNRLVAQDVSQEHAWQFSQEFRLASNFKGPFNFSIGGNYMHYETVEDYYVFANTLSLLSAESEPASFAIGGVGLPAWVPGVSDNHECLGVNETGQYHSSLGPSGIPGASCYYIDPNPLGSLNGQGHNYFRSQNPYVLNSYARFGEAYYNVTPDLKLTGGVRWTDDQKHFIDIPSQLLVQGIGFLPSGVVNQEWNQLTGRLAADWTPKLDFTDQTLIYGSFAHGYKAGGANPPGALLTDYNPGVTGEGVPVHPLTFKPEFVDAYELGTKNTLLDGGLTLNGDVFFYNYKGYQISKIVDRTAINDNFDATVKGAEIEAMYEPIPGLKFNFAGGYEDTRINNGQSSIDLMDRTAGHPGWVLMKPFPTNSSNCIFPDYVVRALMQVPAGEGNSAVSACDYAYHAYLDPVEGGKYYYNNGSPYYVISVDTALGTPGTYNYPDTIHNGTYPDFTYPGFDPAAGNVPGDTYVGQNTYNNGSGPVDYGPAPNNGEGFAKPLGGKQLPNAPHFTVSLSGDYTVPVSEDWAATLHSDFYWQSQSFARVFNDRPYDKLRGYSTTNLALILTSASGWQVMGYVKNVFDVTAITGDFLNSDDSGLTTNVFLTDPRLYGVRVTRNW